MSTPHIRAQKDEFAPIVLMPGDPLRAKYIAEHYLENITLISDVRNMLAYNGTYQGKRISVMGSGMGMPSIGIYSYELFTHYDVEAIIRIGSAGAYEADLQLFDLILVKESWSESSFAYAQSKDEDSIQKPNPILQQIIRDTAKALNYPIFEKRIHSSDVFYHEPNTPTCDEYVTQYGCSAVEMESFALFHNAKVLNKHAACILTISDSLVHKVETTALERETSFQQMMQLALNSALKWYEKR